jgi:hypothetical protein
MEQIPASLQPCRLENIPMAILAIDFHKSDFNFEIIVLQKDDCIVGSKSVHIYKLKHSLVLELHTRRRC